MFISSLINALRILVNNTLLQIDDFSPHEILITKNCKY